jgi:hypothetical protein
MKKIVWRIGRCKRRKNQLMIHPKHDGRRSVKRLQDFIFPANVLRATVLYLGVVGEPEMPIFRL